jgi:protein tyrosine/serine phosphatase
MLTATGAHARGLPAQQGILNFGRVSERLYRGAQPDSSGLQSLKRLGVKMIVNLRMPGDGWKEEAAEAEANGIVYTNFPMHGTGRPDSEQVKQILALFEKCSGPVFIHCRHGCDRTGTIVACYRIQHDGWSNDLAMREAKRYGISRFEFLMRRFVRSFRATVKADLRQAKAT